MQCRRKMQRDGILTSFNHRQKHAAPNRFVRFSHSLYWDLFPLFSNSTFLYETKTCLTPTTKIYVNNWKPDIACYDIICLCIKWNAIHIWHKSQWETFQWYDTASLFAQFRYVNAMALALVIQINKNRIENSLILPIFKSLNGSYPSFHRSSPW